MDGHIFFIFMGICIGLLDMIRMMKDDQICDYYLYTIFVTTFVLLQQVTRENEPIRFDLPFCCSIQSLYQQILEH